MQNSFDTDFNNFGVKIKAKIKADKLVFNPLHQQIKKNLNHPLINIFKNGNIHEMCNALLKTYDFAVNHFHYVELIQIKKQYRRQIYVQLSAKLTKAFGRCFQALSIFFSQKKFCEPKLRLNLGGIDNGLMQKSYLLDRNS